LEMCVPDIRGHVFFFNTFPCRSPNSYVWIA
jgi:hypothetical protein